MTAAALFIVLVTGLAMDEVGPVDGYGRHLSRVYTRG